MTYLELWKGFVDSVANITKAADWDKLQINKLLLRGQIFATSPGGGVSAFLFLFSSPLLTPPLFTSCIWSDSFHKTRVFMLRRKDAT